MIAIEELEDISEYILTNKDKYYGFIYLTINLLDNKKYIGQKNFDTRRKWVGYLGSGTYLLRAIKKHGKSNFKRIIIDVARTQEELNNKEKFWIFKYNCAESDEYYNIIYGGQPMKSLVQNNSKACICLGTNYILGSIAEASVWSGYPESYITNSFQRDYTNNNLRYIFRPLGYFKKSDKLCICCGKIIDKYRIEGDLCNPCKKKKYRKDFLSDIKCENNKSVPIYSIEDDIITEYLSFHNPDMISKRKRKENRERENLKAIDIILDNNKESILRWKHDELVPNTTILKRLKIASNKNNYLKEFLKRVSIVDSLNTKQGE